MKTPERKRLYTGSAGSGPASTGTLSTPMISRSPEQTHIWRYLTFGRFVSLLQTKRLWLSRVDLLGDDWEMRLAGEQLAHVIARHPPTPLDAVPEDPMERARRIIRNWRLTSFVNCWSAQAHESHALWRVFCPTAEGVAIRSTLERLKASVGNPIEVRKVIYEPPGSHRRTPTPKDLITQKRPMFEYEHEYRLVFIKDATPDETVKGIALEWNPEAWIEAIRIHPEADKVFAETVVREVEQYAPALKDRIQPSDMVEEPPL
jgi:hypothetical protein